MDDYTYLGGNDNSHVDDLIAVQVGPVLVIHQFGYSIQRPESLPASRVDDQRAVVSTVVERIESTF